MRSESKYNVSKDKDKREYGGRIFDSEVEKLYYQNVVLPGVEDGTIESYELQKKYILQPSFMKDGKRVLPIEYKADFYIKYSDGKELVVDIKGFPDSVAKLKRKMFWFVYPNIDYVWLTYIKKEDKWYTYEERQKINKAKKKEKRNNEK